MIHSSLFVDIYISFWPCTVNCPPVVHAAAHWFSVVHNTGYPETDITCSWHNHVSRNSSQLIFHQTSPVYMDLSKWYKNNRNHKKLWSKQGFYNWCHTDLRLVKSDSEYQRTFMRWCHTGLNEKYIHSNLSTHAIIK